MAKRVVSFFLALILSFAVSVPSFAFEVATSSNAEYVYSSAINDALSTFEVSPRASFQTIKNTIDYSPSQVGFSYISSIDGSRYFLYKDIDSSGNFSPAAPLNSGDQFRSVYIALRPGSLPPAGTYNMVVQFSFAGGPNLPTTPSWYWSTQISNANQVSGSANGLSLVVDYTDFQVSGVVSLSNVSKLFIDVGAIYNLTTTYPLSGNVKVSFTQTSAQASTSAGTQYSSENVEQSISDSVGNISSDLGSISSSIDSVEEGIEEISSNTGYMVNGLREMANTLEEIVATISNQLSALWDQLYNNMHLPQLANDDKNTELIVEAIDDIELDISADLEAQTDSINQNNDKNTDTIVNGYDSSSLDASNDALSSAMEISEPLEDFEFDNPITQYLSAFQMFGDFLQDLFVGSGGFKDVINLSFLMPIALIVIGMYRFKGGG